MPNFVKRSSLPLWIALLAILFSALAPSISHAMAARSGNAVYAEICGVDGVKLVALAGSDAGDKQAPAGDSLQLHMKHCPYCATHGGSFGLPPPAPAAFVLLDGADLHPSLFYHAPAPLFAWSAAHPRGPPAA